MVLNHSSHLVLTQTTVRITSFIRFLLSARHCCKCLYIFNAFNPQKSLRRQVLLLSPVYQWGNYSKEISITCVRPHCYQVTELGFELWQLEPSTIFIPICYITILVFLCPFSHELPQQITSSNSRERKRPWLAWGWDLGSSQFSYMLRTSFQPWLGSNETSIKCFKDEVNSNNYSKHLLRTYVPGNLYVLYVLHAFSSANNPYGNLWGSTVFIPVLQMRKLSLTDIAKLVSKNSKIRSLAAEPWSMLVSRHSITSPPWGSWSQEPTAPFSTPIPSSLCVLSGVLGQF